MTKNILETFKWSFHKFLYKYTISDFPVINHDKLAHLLVFVHKMSVLSYHAHFSFYFFFIDREDFFILFFSKISVLLKFYLLWQDKKYIRGFCFIRCTRRVWRYQREVIRTHKSKKDKQQWPKEKVQKYKQRSTKHTTKDRVTRTSLKTLIETGCWRHYSARI